MSDVRCRGPLSSAKNLSDFLDRVPIARSDRHTQALLDLAEVADRFHLSPIQTQNESVMDGSDLHQPVVVRSRSNRSRVSQHRGICVLSRRGKVGLIQCDDEVRAISQVVSKMCFGRSGRYSNGKIDQADRFRQYWIRALA